MAEQDKYIIINVQLLWPNKTGMIILIKTAVRAVACINQYKFK